MKMNRVAIIRAAFFLGFGMISSIAARAEFSPDCKTHQDATYCSTYNVTMELASQIETSEDASTGILLLVKVLREADYDIRYFATFKLILSIANIEEGFSQTEDYRQLKNSLIYQMLRYQSLTGDEARPQVYLTYLHDFIEPAVKLPKSANYPKLSWPQPSEKSNLLIRCVVENDVPFLSLEELEASAAFSTCMNG